MAKAKSTTGMAVAEMLRIMDMVVSKASRLKSRIENVQCTAIDTRLTLMDNDASQHPRRTLEALQHIVSELSSLIEDASALFDAICAASANLDARPRLN